MTAFLAEFCVALIALFLIGLAVRSVFAVAGILVLAVAVTLLVKAVLGGGT